MTKIVSACCGARLRWRKRRQGTTKLIDNPMGMGKISIKIPGPLLRAYVCDDCGKPDR